MFVAMEGKTMTKRLRGKPWMLPAAIGLLFIGQGWAQLITGDILGTVTDPGGDVNTTRKRYGCEYSYCRHPYGVDDWDRRLCCQPSLARPVHGDSGSSRFQEGRVQCDAGGR
jgi:hypothetical protein